MTKPSDLQPFFEFWRLSLKGERPPLHSDQEPQPGFYRVRNKRAKTWYPVAFWLEQPVDDNGELSDDERIVAKVGRRVLRDEVEIEFLWYKACQNPVSYEAYTHALQYNAWADDPVVEEAKPEIPKIIAAEAAPLY
jgi:hypothetical protein